MSDVVAMGELLVDFSQNGSSEKGNPIFEANPGGAPCNVLSITNAAASIVTTRKGTVCSMPDREEIGFPLANNGKEQRELKTAKSFDIQLGSVAKVKEFVNDMSKIEGDVFLCVGKYVVDAKSIMGIFSLELSKPLRLEIEDWKEAYGAVLERYLRL